MNAKFKYLAVSLAALALAGCTGGFARAPAMPTETAWLQEGAAAPTPRGAAQFCAERPALCQNAASDAQAGMMKAPLGASVQSAAPNDPAALFQTLLAARTAFSAAPPEISVRLQPL